MDTCTAPAGITTDAPGGRPVAVPSRIADSYKNLNSDKP
jgi:hypothetical protein